MVDESYLSLASRVCERYTQVFLLHSIPSSMLNDMRSHKNVFVLCYVTYEEGLLLFEFL